MNNEIAPHKKGDTWNGMVVTVSENGIPVNLTGYTAISQFKTSANGSTAFEFKTNDNTLTIPNPIAGKIYYTGRKIDVSANKYIFDLQIASPDNIIKTIATGYWQIVQDISK